MIIGAVRNSVTTKKLALKPARISWHGHWRWMVSTKKKAILITGTNDYLIDENR